MLTIIALQELYDIQGRNKEQIQLLLKEFVCQKNPDVERFFTPKSLTI